MRLLILADIHGQVSALDRLSALISAADLILIAGDLTEFGGSEDMTNMLSPLAGKEGRVAAVGGNCDKAMARDVLEAAGYSVDGRFKRFSGEPGTLTVVGAGGGQFRAGLTPFERRDGELHAAIEDAMRSLDESSEPHPLLMAISHTPPHGTDADLRNGSHVGSKALRHMMDALAPQAWVCGHIHESRSVSRTGKTLVINPGPLREGYYAEGQIHAIREGFLVEAELRKL